MTALIAVIPSVLAGLFLIINTKLSKRMDKVLTQTKENDILTVENNLLEKLLPVFETKDAALDKIADILAEDKRLRELREHAIDLKLGQLAKCVNERCQAPALIREIQQFKDKVSAEEVNRAILKSLVDNEDVMEHK